MSFDFQEKKFLKKIINKSKNPNIFIVEPDFEDSISQSIDLLKKNSVLIHGVSSNFKDKYKNIEYNGFTYSNIDFDTHNDKKKNTYTLDFIFYLLKWSKIDLLKIDQNEFKINALKGAKNIFSRELVNVTIIKNDINLLNKKDFLNELIEFSYQFKLKLYILENSNLYSITKNNLDTFIFQNQSIVMIKNNYELKIKIFNEPVLKNVVLKKIATFFGNLPFFKGQDRIIRLLYSPNKFKDLEKGEKFTTNYFGFKYKGITSNYIDWGVYFKGGLEKGLINYIKKKISNFDIFIDVGANAGTLSLPFIFEKNLKIICFEPLNYSFRKLEENFKINNAPNKHEINNIALSNINGKSIIYYSKTDENIGTASVNNFYNEGGLSKEEVYLKRFDDLYKYNNKKIFIKIDVEGYEKEVILGMIETLKNNKILMYLESRDNYAVNFLKDVGFKEKYFIFKGNNIKYINNIKTNDIILQNY